MCSTKPARQWHLLECVTCTWQRQTGAQHSWCISPQHHHQQHHAVAVTCLRGSLAARWMALQSRARTFPHPHTQRCGLAPLARTLESGQRFPLSASLLWTNQSFRVNHRRSLAGNALASRQMQGAQRAARHQRDRPLHVCIGHNCIVPRADELDHSLVLDSRQALALAPFSFAWTSWWLPWRHSIG
jgi:hypothetical protein